MIPLELEIDKEGLLYYKNRNITSLNPLLIDNRKIEEDRYYQHSFYSFPSTDEYIIKYCCTVFTRKEIKIIKEMLLKLREKQNDLPNIDFPIGYFIERKKLAGIIVKYYKNGVSCDNVIEKGDIEALGKYYYHDEDNNHNLFLLLNDYLDLLYEMFENGIYYLDTNPGNIILDDNKVKIIDFDHGYVKFDNKDNCLKSIMWGFNYLLKYINRYYYNYELSIDACKDFDESKKYLKKLENSIHRR